MADTGPDTILLDLFRTNQLREQLVTASLDGLELPAEDFRVGRLEKRGHAERVPNPDDRRSYLVSLTADGQQLLKRARPRFRSYAEAVEQRLGQERIDTLRGHLHELRGAMESELSPE